MTKKRVFNPINYCKRIWINKPISQVLTLIKATDVIQDKPKQTNNEILEAFIKAALENNAFRAKYPTIVRRLQTIINDET